MPKTASDLGIKAPSGGFEDLGWYPSATGGSFQYKGGTFGESGTIHPDSPQIGAGNVVSKEVIDQSDPLKNQPVGTDFNYLFGNQGGSGSGSKQPTAENQVDPYLNTFQQNAFDADSGVSSKSGIPTLDELRSELTPGGGLPAPISRVEEFERLRKEQGVEGLEAQLNDLKGQEEDELAFFRNQRFDERGKPVAMGVIAGRVGEEERAASERMDVIGRQKSRINDQLQTSYAVINMYMGFVEGDYQDAVERYNSDFNNNLSMYNIITGKERDARSDFESDRAAANANLTTYINAVTAGNLDYGSLSTDQKTMISKLEVQSGMPVGFIANLKMDPGADIVFQNTSDGVTQIGVRNADGSISVQKYGTSTKGSDGGGGGTDEGSNKIGDAFTSDTNAFKPIDANGTTIGIFPQLVVKYARSMSLSQIYKLYQSSSLGRSQGAPKENAAEIQEIYDRVRSGEEE